MRRTLGQCSWCCEFRLFPHPRSWCTDVVHLQPLVCMASQPSRFVGRGWHNRSTNIHLHTHFQTYMYYIRYPKDTKIVKYMVCCLCMVTLSWCANARAGANSLVCSCRSSILDVCKQDAWCRLLDSAHVALGVSWPTVHYMTGGLIQPVPKSDARNVLLFSAFFSNLFLFHLVFYWQDASVDNKL